MSEDHSLAGSFPRQTCPHVLQRGRSKVSTRRSRGQRVCTQMDIAVGIGGERVSDEAASVSTIPLPRRTTLSPTPPEDPTGSLHLEPARPARGESAGPGGTRVCPHGRVYAATERVRRSCRCGIDDVASPRIQVKLRGLPARFPHSLSDPDAFRPHSGLLPGKEVQCVRVRRAR